LAVRPGYSEACVNLGNALCDLGRADEALAQYEQALRLNADLSQAYFGLGNVRQTQGRIEEAIAAWREATARDPRFADAHNALGLALMGRGRFTEALTHFRAAAIQRPDWLTPHNALAWILATHPDPAVRDPRQALAIAGQAVQQTQRRQYGLLDTLAAAYAAAGRFEDAIATAEEAAARAREAGAGSAAASIEQRLALYRGGRPFLLSDQ
jgi:spermidine synthase